MSRPSAIQRAFALARNGADLSIAVIRQRLRDEGYEDDKITSPVVLRQLRSILVDARRESWKRKLAQRGNHALLSEQKRKRDELQ